MFRILLAAWLASQATACTVVAVGKKASATGSPIVTHADDSGPTTTDLRLVRVPRRQWPEGSKRPLFQYQFAYPRVVDPTSAAADYWPYGDDTARVPVGYIPQVNETYAYWDTDEGVQNEWGLSIGESTTTGRTAGWAKTPETPWGYNLAGIEDLSRIALERCKTARCAVQTMGDIAVDVGFYSSDSGKPESPTYDASSEALVLADATPGEVWVFNILTGANNASAIWAAQRMPDDHITVVANTFTIRKMNLTDGDNFLYSPNVTALAEEKGWWHPSDDESGIFDFTRSYGFSPPDPALPWEVPNIHVVLKMYSGRRMWRVWNLLTPEEGKKLDPEVGNLPNSPEPYPFSLPAPHGSVTLQAVMNVHRDHYEGTKYDLTQGMAAGPHGNPNRGATPGVVGGWERAISMQRAVFSFVQEAKPDNMATLWFGYGPAHGTAYLPFMGAADSDAPDMFRGRHLRQSKFDTKAAFWAFELLNQLAEQNFQLFNKEMRATAAGIEQEGQENLANWQKEADLASAAAGGGEEGMAAARRLLTNKSNSFTEAKVGQWWDLAWNLTSRFGHYSITEGETPEGGATQPQTYPDWWLRSKEVGFTTWMNELPHGIIEDVPKDAVISEVVAQELKEVESPPKHVFFDAIVLSDADTVDDAKDEVAAATPWSFASLFAVGGVAGALLVGSYVAGESRGRRRATKAADTSCHYTRSLA